LASDRIVKLARRLRALREQRWPDLHVTQQHLAEAFGEDGRPLSLSLISSWESQRNPALPPARRLVQYSTFFATKRSMAGPRARLLAESELTQAERDEQEQLYGELAGLRFPDGPAGPVRRLVASHDRLDLLAFDGQDPITIVCSRLPDYVRLSMLYTDTSDPDYVQAYTYADIDSLIELYGHVRAANPAAEVSIRPADRVEGNNFTAHLLLLGGVDWNPVTRDIERRLDLPVKQGTRPDDDLYGGQFHVLAGRGAGTTFPPVLERLGERTVLREDVGHLFYGRNPYNQARKLILFNGMFGRGTYGVVRSLTDPEFRDRNVRYIRDRFGRFDSFNILLRVSIDPSGSALTPDWTLADTRLHEWPPTESDGKSRPSG
jgi:hypothetical protein